MDLALKRWELVRGLPNMLKYEREVAYFSQGLGISSGQGARLPSDEINAEYNQLMKLLSANGKDQDWWTSQGYGDRTRKFIELRDGNRLSALENVWNKRKQGSEGLGIQGIFEDAEGAKVSRFGERIYTDDDLALPEGTQGPEQTMDRDTLAKKIGEKLKTNFEKFDYNRDGGLSVSEIKSMTQEYNPGAVFSEDHEQRRANAGTASMEDAIVAQAMMNRLDENKNQILERAEVFSTKEVGEGDEKRSVEELSSKAKNVLVGDPVDNKGGLIQDVSGARAGLELAVSKYFTGGNPMSILSTIATPEGEEFDQKYVNIAQDLTRAIPFHSIVAEAGTRKEEESRKQFQKLYELKEQNKWTPENEEQLNAVSQRLRAARKPDAKEEDIPTPEVIEQLKKRE